MEDLPDDDFEFDRDIASQLSDPETMLNFAFVEMHEAYLSMREIGFTETEALKFLAFCSIYDGDI
jgi:hypothetical protein